MKKSKNFGWVTASILWLGIFGFASWNFYTIGYQYYTRELEMLGYGAFTIAVALYFNRLSEEHERLRAKIILGVITAFCYTFLVFLMNNFWRYLCDLFAFGASYPVPFWRILRNDLLYSYDHGALRYPIVFMVMVVICGAKIFFSYPQTKKIIKNWEKGWERWLYVNELKGQDLFELYDELSKDSSCKRLIDYVKVMPLTEERKAELVALADREEATLPIYLLFLRYRGMMTEEEREYYKKRFIALKEAHIERCREHYSKAKVEVPYFFDEPEE